MSYKLISSRLESFLLSICYLKIVICYRNVLDNNGTSSVAQEFEWEKQFWSDEKIPTFFEDPIIKANKACEVRINFQSLHGALSQYINMTYLFIGFNQFLRKILLLNI